MVLEPSEGDYAFAKEIQSLARGVANNGILGTTLTDTAFEVTEQATPAMGVTVECAGKKCLINGVEYSEGSAVNLTIDTVPNAGKERRDVIIYDKSASQPAVIKGDEFDAGSANPKELTDEDDLILAIVFVEYGDTTIVNADISDMRTMVRWIDPKHVIGTTSSPTTTSGTPALLPQMTITLTTKGRPVLILFNGEFKHSNVGVNGSIRIRIDASVESGSIREFIAAVANKNFQVSHSWIKALSAASHTIEIYWATSGGTLTAYDIRRCMQVIELN